MGNYNIYHTKEWWLRSYDGRRKEFRGINKSDWIEAKKKAFYRRYHRTTTDDYVMSNLRKAYLSVKEWAKPEHGLYQKVAMYGYTWLYLASPVYGHADYNKSLLLPIEGNERQCEFLMRVSKRVSNTI